MRIRKSVNWGAGEAGAGAGVVDPSLIAGLLCYRDEVGGIPNQKEWLLWNEEAKGNIFPTSVGRSVDWNKLVAQVVHENPSDAWFGVVAAFLGAVREKVLKKGLSSYVQWVSTYGELPECMPDGEMYVRLFGSWLAVVNMVSGRIG